MVQCAWELIENRDVDGFLAMYWLIKWVERKPKFNFNPSGEADEPNPYTFRKHFDMMGDFQMPFPHNAPRSVEVIDKVYKMAKQRIPNNSKIRSGLYDNV